MEIILLMALFAINVCILYFSSLNHQSLANVLNIVSLCLIVALAALLSLLENILWILLSIITVIVVLAALRYYFQRKKVKQLENDHIIDVETEEKE